MHMVAACVSCVSFVVGSETTDMVLSAMSASW